MEIDSLRRGPAQESACSGVVDYTYWQEPDGFYLGYLNCWPDHWTQGKSISELEEMLLDLYDIYLEDEKEKTIEKKTGHLKVVATA